MWDDQRFLTIDGDFSLELAIAADILFDGPVRPRDPRPILRSLVAKQSLVEPLDTAFSLGAAMMAGISPENEEEPREVLAEDLVEAALSDVWDVPDQMVGHILPMVQCLACRPGAVRYVLPPPGQSAVVPEATTDDLLPMVLFVTGLSSIMARALDVAAAGDPIRRAEELRHMLRG